MVFTTVDGKAIWNYIDTGFENATEYTIASETLKEGDQIIVSGNINLAHESPITTVEPYSGKIRWNRVFKKIESYHP